MTGRQWRLLVTFATSCSAALLLTGASAAATASLPNPCTILTAAHPQQALYPTKSVNVGAGHLQTTGTGNFASEACTETVGTLKVTLDLFLQDFGSGGVIDPTEIHPSGIGSGVIITGKSAAGTTVDNAHLHKGSVYAVIAANGATPSGLTTLSRQIYKLLP